MTTQTTNFTPAIVPAVRPDEYHAHRVSSGGVTMTPEGTWAVHALDGAVVLQIIANEVEFDAQGEPTHIGIASSGLRQFSPAEAREVALSLLRYADSAQRHRDDRACSLDDKRAGKASTTQ